MKYKAFGCTGLTVSEIGFGASRIGGLFAGGQSARQALQALGAALDSGITLYDTADIYAQGESESLIGTAFRERRPDVILATKGGYSLPTQRNLLKRIKPLLRPLVRALGLKRTSLPPAIAGRLSQDYSPSYLTRALEGSLSRLQTDYVDLYQLHSPPVSFLQSDALAEALDTLERLKRQGKIRFYGIATELPEDAAYCLSAPGISSVQLGFGLLDPQALERGTLAAAQQRGLAVIARGSFGGGLLKETLAEASLRTATPKWQRILALRSFSESNHRSILDAALQFCRATAGVTSTLLGMRTEQHLIDNLRHYDAPALSPDEYTAFRQIAQGQQQTNDTRAPST